MTYPGLDDDLDANDPQWESDPIAFTNALAGRFDSPAEIRMIEILASDGASVDVQVTMESFLDGSGSHLVLRLVDTGDGYQVERADRTQTCHPGRGPQDYQPASCI